MMVRKTSNTLTGMVVFTGILMLLSGLFFLLYQLYHAGWLLSIAITMLTMFYHFAMRLTVGEVITRLYRGKDFPQDKLGFPLQTYEENLYRRLKVKQWKTNLITAKPDLFDLHKVSPEELLHNVMQAELVHRVIIVLSYVPLLFIIPFGTPAVFIITSILASLIDLQFVMIQRYNRPRVIKYIALMQRKHDKGER